MAKNITRPKIINAKQFARAIHNNARPSAKAAPSLRNGLANARLLTDCLHFPKIVEELKATPSYLRLIAQTQFPPRLEDMKKGVTGLFLLDTESELIWSGAVLLAFKEKLIAFMEQKNNFDSAFLAGDLETANEILNEIESSYGQSIWLFKNRITTLQLLYGLKEQKDYLERIINTNFFSVHGALIAYHASIRSEENVTFFELESELNELPGDAAQYFTYHLAPSNLDQITNPAIIQCIEETQPLIDRLMAHISMCLLYFAKDDYDEQHFSEIIKLSSWIPDNSIQSIVQIHSNKPITINTNELALYNQYAQGVKSIKYSSLTPRLIEVFAYNRAFNPEAPTNQPSSILEETADLLSKAITYASDPIKIKNRLRKISLLSPSLDLAINITAFLEKSSLNPALPFTTTKSRLSLICSSISNPRSWQKLKSENKSSRISFDLKAEQRNMDVVRLFELMEKDFLESRHEILKLKIPTHRQHTYAGHLAYKNGHYSEAENHYQLALQAIEPLPTDQIRSYLFDAIFAQRKTVEAVRLAVDHYLRNPNAVELYPFKELSAAALNTPPLKDDIATAVLISITARHTDPKWERKLSDIHENILSKYNVSKPSELGGARVDFDPRMLIYFLRYVCVSRILDDSSAYDSVEEIEAERIAVCQLLTALDPINKSIYSSEIKDITRNENIAAIWHQYQSSKVYVDEGGLKNYLATYFKEIFNRYILLRDSPALNTQAENLAKALERILKDKNPDFKNIKLPASESEALFNTMIQQFITAFATHPAYGLDTHLSTAVRHGVFEGHIRTALINMLCPKYENDYLLPRSAQKKLACYEKSQIDIRTALIRFTRKVENLISKYLSEYFRIRSDSDPAGLFSFTLTEEVRAESMERLFTISDYEEFMNELFALAWQLTDISTIAIKENITSSLGKQIYQSFDVVLDSLKPTIEYGAFRVIEQEVIEARLRIQKTLEDLAEWFNRPQISHPDEVDLEMVLAVALKQIENCYTDNILTPSVKYITDKKINGKLLTSLVETLFILLQNIIIHCGIKRELRDVNIDFQYSDGKLSITIDNPIDESIDIKKLEQNIVEALERYKKGTGLNKASTEGGSGLSKIWRIMEYEVKKPHHLELSVRGRVFRASLSIESIDLS